MKSTEDMKAFIRRAAEEVWNKGNMDVAGEYFSPNLIFHYSEGDIRGIENMKQYILGVRSAFPDFKLSPEDQIAEGNTEVSRFTISGTHKGEFNSIPPTGKMFSTTSIAIHKFTDGKISEVWSQSNDLGLLQQLGIIPSS